MSRLAELLGFVYENFAPLVVFAAVNRAAGLRAGIAAAIVFSIVDVAVRLARGKSVTRLYAFCFVTTLLFGAIDLYATDPFIFRYESVATNLLTAGFFGITLFRGKPLIEELAEKTTSPEKMARADVREYLWVLTLVWTLYFVAKAAVYGWVSYRYSIEEAMAFRASVGTVSIAALLFGERLLRPLVIRGLRAVGLVSAAPQAA